MCPERADPEQLVRIAARWIGNGERHVRDRIRKHLEPVGRDPEQGCDTLRHRRADREQLNARLQQRPISLERHRVGKLGLDRARVFRDEDRDPELPPELRGDDPVGQPGVRVDHVRTPLPHEPRYEGPQRGEVVVDQGRRVARSGPAHHGHPCDRHAGDSPRGRCREQGGWCRDPLVGGARVGEHLITLLQASPDQDAIERDDSGLDVGAHCRRHEIRDKRAASRRVVRRIPAGHGEDARSHRRAPDGVHHGVAGIPIERPWTGVSSLMQLGCIKACIARPA